MEFTDRKFGVEIEFLAHNANGHITLEEVARALQAAGVDARDEQYNHITQSYWKLITDASCGYELVSPVLSGKEGLAEIKKACDVLVNVVKAKVDKFCGLHVHVNAIDLNKQEIGRIFYAYAKYEKVFDSFMPESRRGSNNIYCKSLSRIWEEMASSKRMHNKLFSNPIKFYDDHIGSRYYKFNLAAYVKHGTVEFRQHSGTIEAEKIINWVVLLVGFVEKARIAHASKGNNNETFAKFVEWLNLRDNAREEIIRNCSKYLKSRFQQFNPDASHFSLL